MQASRAITRKSASNLALAFVLLPKAKRDDMSALYAFCREIDDIADDESVPAPERQARLTAWRTQIKLACDGGQPAHCVARELQRVIEAYHLPYALFDELIQGVEMDLNVKRYATYDELDRYCYRVASVVGLLSIEIFGYRNHRCREYAVHLGKALQLTNILRDVRNDALRGRIYLPASELARFNVAPDEILQCAYSDRFQQLAQSVADRAKCFYRNAREALPEEDRQSMATAELMGSVYWRLLLKLERKGYNVFNASPTGLTKPHKLFLIFRSWWRLWTGSLAPDYGVR